MSTTSMHVSNSSSPTPSRIALAIAGPVFAVSLGVAFPASPLLAQPATAAPAAMPVAPDSLGVVIRDVRVEGLQRIEPGTVFSYLPIQIGDRVTEQGTAEAVRVLFATGIF